MSNESVFSNQMEAVLPDGPPAAPVIKGITFSQGVAQVVVTLPATDADGSALTGLANCYLFVKEASFEGSSPAQEREAGNTPFVYPLSDLQGDIIFSIPGLKYGKTYYFVASCAD